MGGLKGKTTKDPIEEQRREEEKKAREALKKEQGKPEPTLERNIVRLMATDLDGNASIFNALRAIRGVNFSLAKAICLVAELDPLTKTSTLTEDQLKKLEEIVRNPANYNIPSYMLNLRKDAETGKDRHLTVSDLDVSLRQKLSDLMRYGSYRGWRHRLGQPVRGQRTRSSFRKSGSVGVVRAKAKPGEGAKPAEKK
ncbi:MAG: 30S ribosomal protein S13 [Candidatus Aenigmatarchaeota archaeon]|nr:MAG: 30S ribosomal protein S13 [Candidatus Aenigmarchaeota archaeon]